MICGIEQIKTRAGEDRPVRVLHVWLFLTLGAPLTSHFITKMRSPAELNKSCNLGVLPVMNEILFRKNGTEHFFLVSACCKLFSFPCSLSLLHRYQDGTGPEQSATSRGNIPEVKVIMECELLIMLM